MRIKGDFGVQTFTVRHAQKKNIREAYLPLIALGIRRFEVARIDFNEENARTLRSLVEEFGIEIVSLQVKPKYVFGAPEKIISFCKAVGCPNVVISMLPFACILGKEDRFYRFVRSLDGWCERYAERGITLAYHHHNWEYVRLSDGETRMEVLLSETKRLKFVHDTYWTAKCGIDPQRQIEKFGDRLLGIHLRDLAFDKRGLDVASHDAAIGDGVIDFASVLSAADATACEYLVIEQKTKEPYRDIEKSLRSLEAISSAEKNKE